MGFFDSQFFEGFAKPFTYIYSNAIEPVVNRIEKIGGVIDGGIGAVGKIVDKAGDAGAGILGGIEGITSLFSNPMGLVLAITAAVVVVKLITK